MRKGPKKEGVAIHKTEVQIRILFFMFKLVSNLSQDEFKSNKINKTNTKLKKIKELLYEEIGS